MTELDRIAEEITALLKEEFGCYRENSRSGVLPSCDRQFEGVTDDGNNTFFRFLYKNIGYRKLYPINKFICYPPFRDTYHAPSGGA